jgi:hypothetical protein
MESVWADICSTHAGSCAFLGMGHIRVWGAKDSWALGAAVLGRRPRRGPLWGVAQRVVCDCSIDTYRRFRTAESQVALCHSRSHAFAVRLASTRVQNRAGDGPSTELASIRDSCAAVASLCANDREAVGPWNVKQCLAVWASV